MGVYMKILHPTHYLRKSLLIILILRNTCLSSLYIKLFLVQLIAQAQSTCIYYHHHLHHCDLPLQLPLILPLLIPSHRYHRMVWMSLQLSNQDQGHTQRGYPCINKYMRRSAYYDQYRFVD